MALVVRATVVIVIVDTAMYDGGDTSFSGLIFHNLDNDNNNVPILVIYQEKMII